MKRMIKLTIGLALLVLLVAIALVARNHQMNEGQRKLKEGAGADALKNLLPLARLGDSDAQFLVGNAFAYGWGIQRDADKALYWFRRSAAFQQDESDPAAAAALLVGKSYAEGKNGVAVDMIESSRWLEVAAAGGSREARSILQSKKSLQ
jgi:TPR repeat protein